MVSMFPSPYSPFFTSGLLSEGSPFPEPPPAPRRGSLPTDSPPTTLSGSPRTQSSTDDSSTFYFMLQPRRDNVEFRSFLSLDLAESQSLRSASLKRKMPSSSNMLKSDRVLYSWIEEAPKRRLPPLRIRTSRESLRTFPSRKPAPLSALPHVPSFDLPPQLPPISFSAPMRLFSLHKSTRSAPSIYPTRGADPLASKRHPPPSSFPVRPASISSSPSTRSTSTQQRTSNRSDALACLEGRCKSAKRIPRKRVQRNFMSMSDDEDESDGPETPPVPMSRLASTALSVQLSREKEDVVIPTCFDFPASYASSTFSQTSSVPAPRRHRSPTESWFPLASFMDVRDDDLSTWNWRSFIEVASLS